MSGNLSFGMMTSQVVVTFPQGRFILVIETYAIKEHYILSNVYSMTKQMLNIDYFKLKHRAKMSWLTGSASNRNVNTRLYDFTYTKNMGKWFLNWENGPNMRMELLTAKLLNWMFFVYCWRARFEREKTRYNSNVTWYSFLLICSKMVSV